MGSKRSAVGLPTLAMAAVLVLMVCPALATTYYVDSLLGNDQFNSGTLESPWATIARADTENLQPGDVVEVSGEFNMSYGEGDLTVSSGTPEAPITYVTYTGAKLTGVGRPAIKVSGNVSNVIIDGFEITGAGVKIAGGADNITVRNCYIHAINVLSWSNVYTKIDLLDGGSANCRIERNLLGDLSETPLYDWAIGQVATTNLQIYNNTILNGCVALCDLSGAIGQTGSDGTVLKNNIIVKMWMSAIALYGSTGFVHTNNLYWDTMRVYDAGAATVPDSTEIQANPLFVGGSPFDYHLTACSPAINTGVDVGLSGSNGLPDMGCFETSYTTEGRISGTVTKSTSGEPLQGATVELVGGGQTTATDAAGKYSLCGLIPGTYTVRASFPGADPKTADVEVSESTTTIQDFVLQILPKTYYVDPDGDGGVNGDGSEAHPWKQIDYGDNNNLLYPGDTVLVQPGTYGPDNFSSTYGVSLSKCSGAAGSPITYKANGAGVKIVRANAANEFGFWVAGPAMHDIAIDGFDISQAQAGVWINAADRISVTNCYIHDANVPGAYGFGIALRHQGSETAEGCVFMNNVVSNVIGASGGAAIILYTGNGTKVYHNTLDACKYGFWLVDVGAPYDAVQFKNNIVSNNSWGIAIGRQGIAVWENNCYWNNTGGNGGGGGGEFVGDPKYVGGSPFDYHLQEGSAAIDMGAELGYPYQGTEPDCGAFESPYARQSVTYHVRPNGDNGGNGDGTEAHPWKLIDLGDVLKILKPGDTVLVHAGTYGAANVSQIGVQLAWCSGKPGFPITYKAEPGAVIDMQGAAGKFGFADQYWGTVVPPVHDIVIDGFEIANTAVGVYIAGGSRIIVKNCYIHGAGTPTAGNSYGIQHTGLPAYGYPSDDCVFQNNVIANLTNNLSGAPAISVGTDGGSLRTRVYNNTMDAADYAWYMVDAGYGPSVDWQWTNNIVTNMRQWIFATTDFSQFHYQYNLFWGNPADVMGGLGDVVADPLFVGGSPFSYALQSGSPAVDAGLDVGLPFQGLAPDMGAFESAYTGGAPYGSLVDVKALPVGSAVRITEPKIVTVSSATFADGSYYVEEPNRVSGMKVKPEVAGLASVVPGDAITMLGVVRADASGEKYIGLHEIAKSSGKALSALGASGRGAAFSRLAGSGILVRTWGRVTKVTADYIYVDDGTGYDDGSDNGVGIRIMLSGLASPITKTFTAGVTYVKGVTGAAGLDAGGVACLRPRGDADIQL